MSPPGLDRVERQLDELVAADGWAAAERLIRPVLPFDSACWLTLDPSTLLITAQWSRDLPDVLAQLAHNEYLVEDVNKFADLARRRTPAGVLSQATGGRPERSPRYRDGLRPNGFGPELRAALVSRSVCWGSLVLLRDQGRPDFEADDIGALTRLAPALARTFRGRALAAAPVPVGTGTPGVLLVNPDGHVECATATAARWLEELADYRSAALPAVAAAARAQRTASACVRGGEGTWLTLDAAVLEGDRGNRVSVVVQPAAPATLAARLMAAYELSGRECDVLALVLGGWSTRRIAGALVISPHTVQDHLKGIFDKVGVRSRRELVAQVFHSRNVL